MKTDAERLAARAEARKTLESLWRSGGSTYSEKVELHSECYGRGYLVVEGDLVDYHKREYAPDTRKMCTYCAGTGRVRVVTSTVTLPYSQGEDL